MTSKWDDLHLDELVEGILQDVRQVDESHHFGRLFMTAYQLALKLQAAAPRRRRTLCILQSVAAGLARTSAWPRLWPVSCPSRSSRHVTRAVPYAVEGAFLSNDGITELIYANLEGGRPVESSLTGGPKDLAVFRLRA